MKSRGYKKQRAYRTKKNSQHGIRTDSTQIVRAMAYQLRGPVYRCINLGRTVREDKTAAHPDAMTEASGKRNRDNGPPFNTTHYKSL